MISMGIAAPRLDTLATKPYLASRLSTRCYLALHITEHGVDQYLSTENCRVKWHKSRGVYIQTLSLITCLVSYIDLQQHISRLTLAGSGISLASQSYHTAVVYTRRNVYSELGTSSPSIIERHVLFKYRPGTWDECRRRIEEMQRAELPDRKLFLYSEEECYNNYLKSEDALSSLLGFSSVVCILISIFGIYSLVTLACERRRKEIAIRKVNGATVRDILALFFREYALLLVVSSLIAFPTAWWAMKRWIENYNRQVEIGILPFLLIFAGIAACVAASIGHRIWKTANENPAEVIKSE